MRKILLIMIICLMSAALLTGCGASADSDLNDKPENVEENKKEDEAGKKDDKDGSGKKSEKKMDASFDPGFPEHITMESGLP